MRKAALLTMILLAGTPLFAGVRIGIGIGIPFGPVPAPVYAAPAYVAPAPPVVAYAAPAPGLVFVGGYWGPGRVWFPGRWVRPPFRGAAWVGPRYFGGRYFAGYWRR